MITENRDFGELIKVAGPINLIRTFGQTRRPDPDDYPESIVTPWFLLGYNCPEAAQHGPRKISPFKVRSPNAQFPQNSSSVVLLEDALAVVRYLQPRTCSAGERCNLLVAF